MNRKSDDYRVSSCCNPSSSHTAHDDSATLEHDACLYIKAGNPLTVRSDPFKSPLNLANTTQNFQHRLIYYDYPSAEYTFAFNKHEIAHNRASAEMANKNKSSQQHQLMSSESPADQARALSQNNKDQLISSLRTHKLNTITELRRVEKIFAYLDSEEVTEPMTSAWAHYVNSNNLLNELRGLTKRIPFSSECVDEAKAKVVADPASIRSWNFCWLVLIKIEKESLILKYAKALASKRSTWGDRQPTADDARKFIAACMAEWNSALRQMLKHWDTAPTTTGN